MRLSIMSDIHFEFMPDKGKSFVKSLDPTVADVLIVAGDLSNAAGLEAALRLICERYAPKPVLYVPGNHEFYGGSISTFDVAVRVSDLKNLHWLHRRVVEIGGVRFAGCTLWFPRTPEAELHRDRLNDFFEIEEFEPWVWEENEMDVAFLEREVGPGTVVITHHLPSQRSVAARYRGSPLNACFVCDVERNVIDKKQPQLWIHGHTHTSCDYKIGETRVVCNPHGYLNENRGVFNPGFVVEVKS